MHEDIQIDDITRSYRLELATDSADALSQILHEKPGESSLRVLSITDPEKRDALFLELLVAATSKYLWKSEQLPFAIALHHALVSGHASSIDSDPESWKQHISMVVKSRDALLWLEGSESYPDPKSKTVTFAQVPAIVEQLCASSSKVARQFCSLPLGKKTIAQVQKEDVCSKSKQLWNDKFAAILRSAEGIRLNTQQAVSQCQRVKADLAAALQCCGKDIAAEMESMVDGISLQLSTATTNFQFQYASTLSSKLTHVRDFSGYSSFAALDRRWQ